MLDIEDRREILPGYTRDELVTMLTSDSSATIVCMGVAIFLGLLTGFFLVDQIRDYFIGN